MKRNLRSIWSLTVASFKMYVRNRTGLFFTLFIPIVLVAVFGFLSGSNGNGSIKLNINDQAHTATSQAFIKAVKNIKAFAVTQDDANTAKDKLGKGKIDLEVIIPGNFGKAGPQGIEKSTIIAQYNQGRPSNGQTAGLILGQLASGFNNQVTKAPQVLAVQTQGVKTNNLNTIDFLLPGIIAMSIMQLGIFSVAFAFVSYKTTGALRRIQATPTHPLNFIIGQAATRLVIAVLQVVILAILGIKFFNFHLIGSPVAFVAVAVLGSLVFLAFGFAIAGYAKDENQAAPFAQLIQFPMLFLSGVFFSRDAFPGWLKTVTDYFPLTYLADAMRRIANEGAHLTQIGGDLLGLTIWGIVVFFIAVRVFRWE
jgi:ABC-2 type transport system permease protein